MTLNTEEIATEFEDSDRRGKAGASTPSSQVEADSQITVGADTELSDNGTVDGTGVWLIAYPLEAQGASSP